jgi:hypothetical protein
MIMSIDHEHMYQQPRELTPEERAARTLQERQQDVEPDEYESHIDNLSERKGFKTWHKVAAGVAGVALGAVGFLSAKAFGGNDHEKALANRPVAAAPANPGVTHEAAPTTSPEEGGFEKLPPLLIDGKLYGDPNETREEIIGAASKAFEIPADTPPEEATKLLVEHLNTVLNWASTLPNDPALSKKYDNYKLTETENSNDPNYTGYGGVAQVREEGIFPAAKKGIVGEWSGGDADGMKDPKEWFDEVKGLSQKVGNHAGAAQGSNLPPYSLEFKITPPDSNTPGIEVAGSIDGKTDISVFLTTKEKGLAELQQLKTADGSTFGSLKESGILHMVLQKESNGTQKIVSALFEQTS